MVRPSSVAHFMAPPLHWRLAEQTPVGQHSQLVVYSLGNVQPVTLAGQPTVTANQLPTLFFIVPSHVSPGGAPQVQ